ncbi:MAG: biosynthetic arginine decarboxylase [Spirochaetaceae bacterium]|nr:MAG: biosynthetic arginine decarboxylase [Spirochaetaceae bacterium]
MAKDLLHQWKVSESADLYGIKEWGAGYFDLNDKGEAVVRVRFPSGIVEVSLMDVVQGINARGLGSPVLLRIQNLLDTQITLINESFRKAMKTLEYKGEFRGVFPIKVNQQHEIINEIIQFGKQYHHGLEAGSKAELLVALAMIASTESPLICNGYKDAEFIDLGLQATQMGYKVFFVVEMPSELPLIIERSQATGIRPNIGVRLKIAAKGGGHWSDSGGDNSLFGLTATQIVDVVDALKAEEMLDCLKLVHYHLGSQIPNIRDIRVAVQETVRFYADLVEEGAAMGYIDLGGGLAVDYDGSKTNFVHSMNYNIGEYCLDVIEVVMQVLDDKGIEHPTVITESGRATVAYSTLLVFDVLEASRTETRDLPEKLPEDSQELLLNLEETLRIVNVKNLQECYNDAVYYREQVREHYKLGQITLRNRALAENYFLAIMKRVVTLKTKIKRMPAELENLESALFDVYYGNFSVFQSLPDSWAIDQVFPVIPLHKLNEEPTRKAIIADMTCDSDGKLDRFADFHDVRRTIPIHDLSAMDEYYIGVFLVGAYQETLGDFHNLFGDTHVVSIRINEDGSFDFVAEQEGDSIADVVSIVHYDPKTLIRLFREKAELAVRQKRLTVGERRRVMDNYESSMNGYTYFKR